MIKTILVPATGNDMDLAVFQSALTVARAFSAHLEFLHVHPDATAMAATMSADVGVGAGVMVSRLADQIEEDAGRWEAKARHRSGWRQCARSSHVVLAKLRRPDAVTRLKIVSVGLYPRLKPARADVPRRAQIVVHEILPGQDGIGKSG